ncbi:surface antigen D15 domain-containing protein [Calothrix sp. NIES-4071]|nr:surface antigen D15 domain-containing protein [Calothrix sp. NIES-4071]BAZ62869.1 surface antigen D15 domain-containing protein [Calothrix sp. NIES-4105]
MNIKRYFYITLTILLNLITPKYALAQTAPGQDLQRQIEPPPTPTPNIPKLPSPQELFQFPSITTPTPPTPQVIPNDISGTIKVTNFEIEGSTVFNKQQLNDATKDLINRPISFTELLQAADRITSLYTKGCNDNNSKEACYINSGAYIPADQTFKVDGGVVKIRVIEGSLENIDVKGTQRLHSDYVRSRLALGADKPLNLKKLLEALQLLQLDPLINNVKAELATGITPGGSILAVQVREAKTFSVQLNLNNNRQPSIGSFERQIQFNQANLLGLGDGLSVAYANTDGSNSVYASYQIPLNPQNGTLTFNYNYASSEIIEKPFDIFGIEGTSQEYGITYRQPLIRTPTKEFALSLSATRRESDIGYLEALLGQRFPFPSPGADENGQTRATILRFAQDWTQRGSSSVFAARSQLSLGIDAFDATTNTTGPDGEFFAWRGQAQWVKLLAPDTLFIARTDLQLADRPLLPSEQIGLGGQATVRGYRQDRTLSDNGFLASAELRYPVLRVPEIQGLLQVTPFIDFGTAWNTSNAGRGALNPDTLASVGLGLLWQQNNRLTARFDWGIPLGNVSGDKNSWQENGLYFSIIYNQPF